jgi:hypothetical protein
MSFDGVLPPGVTRERLETLMVILGEGRRRWAAQAAGSTIAVPRELMLMQTDVVMAFASQILGWNEKSE